MRIITARDKIRTVVTCWKQTYHGGSGAAARGAPAWTPYGLDKKAVYDRLLTLDLETATEDDVAAIIGNDTWTRLGTCNECGSDVRRRGVALGEGQDHEDGPTILCFKCAKDLICLVLGLHTDIFIPA